MADTLTEYAHAYAPPWLLGEWGEKFLAVIGDAKEAQSELAREAVKARMSELAPADALVRIDQTQRAADSKKAEPATPPTAFSQSLSVDQRRARGRHPAG